MSHAQLAHDVLMEGYDKRKQKRPVWGPLSAGMLVGGGIAGATRGAQELRRHKGYKKFVSKGKGAAYKKKSLIKTSRSSAIKNVGRAVGKGAARGMAAGAIGYTGYKLGKLALNETERGKKLKKRIRKGIRR